MGTTNHFICLLIILSPNIHFYPQTPGEIPLTGSATLSLTLTDINDNAPMFAENYQPVVPENENNNRRKVVEIFARDPDTREFGPPFGFALPNGCSVPACSKFSLQYNSGGLLKEVDYLYSS